MASYVLLAMIYIIIDVYINELWSNISAFSIALSITRGQSIVIVNIFYPQRVESLGSKACIRLGPSDRSYPRYSSFIVHVEGALNDLGGASNINRNNH